MSVLKYKDPTTNEWKIIGGGSAGEIPITSDPSADTTVWIDPDDVVTSTDSLYTKVAYGVCETPANNAKKEIELSQNINWVLEIGSIIAIKFTETNTANNPTFNVDDTGEKPVEYSSGTITTSSLSMAGYKDRTCMYMYNGTGYIFLGWSYDANSTYTNASLGQGYGTCSTAAATAAKVVTLSSYSLTKGGVVSVKFTYDVPANATMNINSKGAKNIYYRGAKITADVINAGDIATFIYDGTQYHLIANDNNFSTMTSNLTVSSANPQISVIDTDSNAQGALWQSANQTVLSNRNVSKNKTNQRSLVINNSAHASSTIDTALRLFVSEENKEDQWYNVLHTGNTGVAAPTSLREGYLRYFTSLTPLGVTKGEETIASMIAAMPNYSMLMLQINTESDGYNSATYPSVWGLLTIKKYNNYRVEIDYMDIKSNPKTFYKKSWNNGTESDWFELLHTGNTGSLADFNKYVWKRRKVNPNLVYGEEAMISFTVGTYKTKTEVSDLSTISFIPEPTTVSYSSNYSMSLDNISFALANPTNETISTYSANALSILKGKYWKRDSTYYYTDSNAVTNCMIASKYGQIGVDTVQGVGYVPIMGYTYSQIVTISATKTVTLDSITYGDWETITSTNATAYPETFTYSNGYEYIKYGGIDRRQTSTTIKHMTYYGTGTSADLTIYVDEIPTLFIIYEGSVPILFKWGCSGIVLQNGVSSGISTINDVTYNDTNKSITFSKAFGKDVNYMNGLDRHHCYFIYG